jgi:hypothetical protein
MTAVDGALAQIENSIRQARSFCKTCGTDTPHEIHRGEGLVARVCVPCLVRAMGYPPDSARSADRAESFR